MSPARRSTGRAAVDWVALHRRLDERRAAFEEASAGRGPWAEDILRRRTEELAGAGGTPTGAETADGRVALLLARGVHARYALDLTEVRRTQPVGRWTPVPGAPPHLLGLIAMGGRVVRLFDVDRLCDGRAAPGQPGEDGTGGFAVLLRAVRRAPLALHVRAVEAVDWRPAAALRPAEGRYVKALTEDHVAVLDVAAIVEDLDG